MYVSRLERRADMKLSTLREYVRALGGDLQLMVTFPGDLPVRLRDIGTISGGKDHKLSPNSKLRKTASIIIRVGLRVGILCTSLRRHIASARRRRANVAKKGAAGLWGKVGRTL